MEFYFKAQFPFSPQVYRTIALLLGTIPRHLTVTEVVCGHDDLEAVLGVDPLERRPPEGVPRDVPDHARVVDQKVQFGKLVFKRIQ